MDTVRECGCKGCRTCLFCEEEFGIINNISLPKENGTYVYCHDCRKAYEGWDMNDYKKHPNHSDKYIEYPGVLLLENFLNEKEESYLLENIDAMPWDLSQSGRRKQNFGPKCNFKKKKLALGSFEGFPEFSIFVQEKFKTVPILQDFQTIEQCSLEYNPSRGASIDPHVDDCWIWGERIVTVNLLSDSVLTMTYNDKGDRYNLSCVKEYPKILEETNNTFNKNEEPFQIRTSTTEKQPIVRIPMPRRSLLVIFGSPRYNWEHQILREDITSRRVCLAYREFTPPYLPGGEKFLKGQAILEKAKLSF